MFCVEPHQLRKLEAAAIDSGIPEYTLMLRAGCGAAAEILSAFPDALRFVFLCGKGNNGGDALVAATDLYRRGKTVIVYSVSGKEEFGGSAGCAVGDLPPELPFLVRKTLDSYDFLPGDLIIDGLLGIGFDGGTLRCAVRSFIKAANEAAVPVVALDIPSGVCGASGKASADGAIEADLTISFGLPKCGLFQGEGSILRGALRMVGIGIENFPCEHQNEVFTNFDSRSLRHRFKRDCHKNSRGRVLIVGGSELYPGAPVLAARAALHSGAGIVRVASSADLGSRITENALITLRTDDVDDLEQLFAASDSIVCGCGWGEKISEKYLQKVLSFSGRIILDADALNMISRNPSLWRKPAECIITPHPGEAARLMKSFDITDAGCRRSNAAALAETLGVAVVLKGRDSVVALPDGRVVTVAAGSALLATAGSGDVLAGVIGALATSRERSLAEAAMLGVYYHGIAGELCGRIISADELIDNVSKVIYKNI